MSSWWLQEIQLLICCLLETREIYEVLFAVFKLIFVKQSSEDSDCFKKCQELQVVSYSPLSHMWLVISI